MLVKTRQMSSYSVPKLRLRIASLLVHGQVARTTAHSKALLPFSFSFQEHNIALQQKAVSGERNERFTYKPAEEYQRQGLRNISSSWRMTSVNSSYTVPDLSLAVSRTKASTDATLIDVAAFRSKNRLPVLTYYEANTCGAILRSSQPMVGVRQKRSRFDEQFIKDAGATFILDLRPKKNAVGNMAMGKGFENAANYTGVKLLFMDIENIHVIRNSLNQIHAICYGSKTGKDSLQYESTWLSA